MNHMLDRAEEALAGLPEHDQQDLIDQLVEAAAVRRLKLLIDDGQAALARGDSKPYDIEAILRKANAGHGDA